MQLETAQGTQDEEARRALAVLQEKTEELALAQSANGSVQTPPSASQRPSNIELASTLDKCALHILFLLPNSRDRRLW